MIDSITTDDIVHISRMELQVRDAIESDISQWLDLAGENTALFGSDMAHDPEFRTALQRNIARGSAFCVRINGELAGAMLFRNGCINWLAVCQRYRRQGVGRALVTYALSSGAHEIRVTTFGDNHPHLDAHLALALYQSLGFTRSEIQPEAAPDGTPRIVLVWRG